MNARYALPCLILVACLAARVGAQSVHSNLEGMWSDPPATAVGSFCFFACTDVGIQKLNALLDDPANDARPFGAIQAEAKKFEGDYFLARLTDAARKKFPVDPADDPGFRRCEPWGLARQMIAPHQLEIRRRGNDRVELHYGEWEARRIVYMDGRKRPPNQVPSPLGFSVGRWEGETLIVETSGVTANLMFSPQMAAAMHSDQLQVVERFSRSKDGKVLQLEATLRDPMTFREPWVLKKIWSWAPEQKIGPYKDCRPATEFTRGVQPQ